MTPADIDRVFGRGRLRMVTGDHVEVFREASLPGERRRYTKRFLATAAGDFRHWTEREWRILARLVGHGIGPVPDVVQFDRGAADRPALVQTYDAGITVDHWATLLPVERDGAVLRHVFEDCAHWWALAHHCLIALDAIHELQLVHLDLKADNVCIPFGPADFNPQAAGQLLSPRFEQIALIDFAFSLVCGESLTRALPIARQTDYDYQSPRLLQALEAGSRGDLMPTRQLDWRCDVFSLAAMLRRYLPDPEAPLDGAWTRPRYAQARALVRRLLEAHDAVRPVQRPHAELLTLTSNALADAELAESLRQGWTLAIHSEVAGADSPTPVTRIALPVSAEIPSERPVIAHLDQPRRERARARRLTWLAALVSLAAIGAPPLYDLWWASGDRADTEIRQSGPKPPAAAPGPPPESLSARASEANPALVVPVTANERAVTAKDRAVASTESVPVPVPPLRPVPIPLPPPRPEVAPVATADAPARVPTPMAAAAATLPAPAPRTAAVRAKLPARPAVPAARAPAATARETPATVAAATRARARPATPPMPGGTQPISERERALAWLTSRGPSPKFAVRPGLSAWPAVALAPAPAAPVPAPARVTAPPQATAPATAPAAAPMAAQATVAAPATLMTAPALGPARTAEPLPAPRSDEPPAAQPRDFALRAGELMTSDLPQLAQRAERRVLRVMNIAAQPDSAWLDEEIRRAASTLVSTADDALPVVELAPEDARLLHEAARVAFWRRGSTREALDLQLKAFGANPLDADIVGSLAFLSLKQGPSQAELARQLALYALTLPNARRPGARLEDWTTLAIASALSGRERDARNAWFVTLALAAQPERQCRAAINAYALHGERVRPAVEAMLYRAHASGRAEGSALCEWPPYWLAARPMR